MPAAEPPRQYEVEEPFQPPKIHLKHMSMALRLTSEWNRRLLDGVNRFKFWGKTTETRPQQKMQQQQPPPQLPQQQQGYGGHPVNINPSRAWHPPISEGPQEVDMELTLFHAKAPRDTSSQTQPRGVARWGPELLPYLEHVVELLGVTDGVEIPLAMIYLDRACSVETTRSNGVSPCPFCTPRTVHRLSLVALLLAAQVVHGEDQDRMEECYERLQSLGIPMSQLQQMVDWMRGALGDPGLLVTVNQMKNWSQSWDSIFYPKQQQRQQQLEQQQRQQQLEQQQQQQQQQLEQQQSEQLQQQLHQQQQVQAVHAQHYHHDPHDPQMQSSQPYQ
jgi:hypothetical protein